MFIERSIFANPFLAVWQFIMSDKPVVLERVEVPPELFEDGSAGLRDGADFIYTVELQEGHPLRVDGQTTRQIYSSRSHELRSNFYLDCGAIAVILPEFEGLENFQAAIPGQTVVFQRGGRPGEDIIAAIRAYDTENPLWLAPTQPPDRRWKPAPDLKSVGPLHN